MPDWKIENEHQGLVCGIDEAGRGPWAGPVVAGAVVFLTREVAPELQAQLNDSKKLSAKNENIYMVCCGKKNKPDTFCAA